MEIRRLAVAILVVGLGSVLGWAQTNEQALRNTVERFQSVLEGKSRDWETSSATLFSDQRREELTRLVADVRKRTAGYEVADIMIGSSKGTFVFETPDGPIEINFQLSSNPVRIESIAVGENGPASPPITWDSLESEMHAAAKDGFTGAVLVTRGGKIVLKRAFGYANREKQILNQPNTVFAIGSAPIDFTHASILILKDRGKIRLSDSIGKYFANVPQDKSKITIRHLMTGESGLPDFHDLPTDAEPDHTWIDRDEAVRRIMNQKLLFTPGTDDQHSHSAWGLLAAIVEIASGQSYQEFTHENLYKPAGMKDTGFFGNQVAEERIAVGYGFRKSSEPNSPPHWGKTSWLVMGSGGQVSTLPDLYRWELAVRAGKIMSPESTKSFLGNGNRVSADGDMYGFEFLHSHNPECMFMLISNAISSRDERQSFDQLGRRLYELTHRELNKPGKYTVGLTMAYDTKENTVIVREIVPGGACDGSGMREGDVLLSANGVEFGHPNEVLRPASQDGKPIKFVVRRDGKRLSITVKPKLRSGNGS